MTKTATLNSQLIERRVRYSISINREEYLAL